MGERIRGVGKRGEEDGISLIDGGELSRVAEGKGRAIEEDLPVVLLFVGLFNFLKVVGFPLVLESNEVIPPPKISSLSFCTPPWPMAEFLNSR